MAITQKTKSLRARGSSLSDTFYQLDVLNGHHFVGTAFQAFDETLSQHGYAHLLPVVPEVLQVNVGKLCNQTCGHCHVDAGPDRPEVMNRDLLEHCLQILKSNHIPQVDITGGAPELNPHFEWFVEACSDAGIRIIDRCNLTIIVSNPRFHRLPAFLAEHRVQIIASLPHYTRLRTDSQRGAGVYDDSISGLKKLNAIGYGVEGSGLSLDLVYNPSGAFLPSGQSALEYEFKDQLLQRHGVVFNRLYTITNLPISRFLDFLIETGNYQEYMSALVTSFNPATVSDLMCRNTLSVSWDGFLYDCDFNQMLDLKVSSPVMHISSFDLNTLMQRRIVTNQHCYGCTAGAGSSCGGALA